MDFTSLVLLLLGGGLTGYVLGQWQRYAVPTLLRRRLAKQLVTHRTSAGEVPTPGAVRAFRYATGTGAKRVAKVAAFSGVLASVAVYLLARLLGVGHLLLPGGLLIGFLLGIRFPLNARPLHLGAENLGGRVPQTLRRMSRFLWQLQANEAVAFVAQHPTPGVVQLVGQYLPTADPQVQSELLACVLGLAQQHPSLVPDAVAVGMAALGARNERTRQEALLLVTKLDRQALAPQVGLLLKDPSPNVRRNVLQLYDLLTYDNQVQLLTDALRDPHPDVQRSALQLIQRTNPIGEVEWLNRAQDPNPTVRQTAARALGAYNHPAALAVLKELLNDREDLVQQAAITALATLATTEATAALAARIADEKRPEKLILLARSVGRHQSATAVPALLALLDHRQEPVRIAASEALVQTGTPAAQGLIEALNHESERVRIGAARSLWLLKDPSGLKALAAMGDDASAEVRELALKAIGELNPDERLRELRRRIADASYAVRIAALGELARLDAIGILPDLSTRLKALRSSVVGSLVSEENRQEQAQLLTLLHRLSAPQRELAAQPQAVFCTQCRRRPTPQGEPGWLFLSCSDCTGTAHLRPGTERVVGTIGPTIPADNGSTTLYLPLWDETAQRARPADIDALHIQGGAAELNYDWAISAVLQALHDRLGHRLRSLPITTEALPPLAPNTLRLLAEAGAVL